MFVSIFQVFSNKHMLLLYLKKEQVQTTSIWELDESPQVEKTNNYFGSLISKINECICNNGADATEEGFL